MITQAELDELLKEGEEYWKSIQAVAEAASKSEKEDISDLCTYTPSDNEMKIVERCKDYLPQISPHLIFSLSAILGGVSVILVAPKASGKSMIVKSAILSDYKTSKNRLFFDKITLDFPSLLKSDSKYIVGIDDLTYFIADPELSEKVLPLLSSLINNRRYQDEKYHIENTELTIIGGGVNTAMESIMSSKVWESMVSDRMLRYYIYYYNRPEPKFVLSEPNWINIGNLDISENATIDGVDITNLRNIFAAQVSYERTTPIVENLLKGHAMLCGRDKVDESDIQWLSLYEWCISSELAIKSERLADIGEGIIGQSFNKLAHTVIYYTLLSPNIKLRYIANRARIQEGNVRRVLKTLDCIKCKITDDGVYIESPVIDKLRSLIYIYEGDEL